MQKPRASRRLHMRSLSEQAGSLSRMQRGKSSARGSVERSPGRRQGPGSRCGEVFASHHRAIELYRRTGFELVYEAVIRGRRFDTLAMGLQR
jgi:hypothetical protein